MRLPRGEYSEEAEERTRLCLPGERAVLRLPLRATGPQAVAAAAITAAAATAAEAPAADTEAQTAQTADPSLPWPLKTPRVASAPPQGRMQ